MIMLFLVPGCLDFGSDDEASSSASDGPITIEVWHTFAAESKEEVAFTNAVRGFETAHPNITVEITLVPFGNADQLFMTAAQGGEAPDLMRLSSDQLGAIGEVRVDGYPLLEDLRPHLTPQDRAQFEARALDSMRYGDELYGIPASQDCLSLIYNKALFDAEGLDYPNENWTEQDLLQAAQQLTQQDVQGLALPIKTAYWWFPIQEGFGGSLFDEQGNPTLDSNGSSEAMRWMLDLELTEEVVATGTQIEGMKNQFITSEAAMIVDGPWNWATYEASRLDVGQSILPTIDETGERVAPLVTYKGWTVSKQSAHKLAAVELALHLSSEDVQKTFALETYTLPTHTALGQDPEVRDDPVLSGFMDQLSVGTPAPTTRAMALVYGPLVTAFEQVYTETASAQDALDGANAELLSQIDGLQQAQPPPANEGYRTIAVNFTTDGSTEYTILVDGVVHSGLTQNLSLLSGLPAYESCSADGIELLKSPTQRVFESNASIIECSLTGMVPNTVHVVQVQGENGVVFEAELSTNVADVVPEAGDTSPCCKK